MENDKPTRRSALNIMLGVSGLATLGAIGFPIISFLKPPAKSESSQFSVTLDMKFSTLKPGDWTIFRFGTKPGLLICDEKDGEKILLAYSATCTHLNCIVEYQPEERTIFCPCHKGSFDINGNNIAGPPPKPLQKFRVQIMDEAIKVLKEG